MTIALALKVNDGIILAADSASTLALVDPTTGEGGVANVYNNANKIANLLKGSPIGMITWGSGSIGIESIATLAKDLRDRFSGKATNYPEWHIDQANYTMAGVAERFRAFMFEEKWLPFVKGLPEGAPQTPDLGFLLAGYSASGTSAEMYSLQVHADKCDGPDELLTGQETGTAWYGQPEAITRLLFGMGTGLPAALMSDLGVPEDQIENAINVLRNRLEVRLVQPAMPIQDAIDLAEFLVDMTVRFHRFLPGAPIVGGPIEVAAVTKHEGFKWIRRKYYYDRAINPEVMA